MGFGTRHTSIKKAGLLALVAAASLVAVRTVLAQTYPSGPVTLVVPTAPGGGMDITARLAAGKLGERNNQTFVVENKPGRVVAPRDVAASRPDGYTLLVAPSPSMAAAIALFKSLPYDPVSDFVPVALMTRLGFVLVIKPSLPAKNLSEFLKYAKDHNNLSYGSAGTGSLSHLATELLKSRTGITATHVPYRGTVPAVTDVAAGHVDFTFADAAAVVQLVADGKLRALAVSSAERLPILPDVPTIAEAGVAGYQMGSWTMIVAPAKTPDAIVNKLNGEFRAVFKLPDVKDKLIKMGFTPVETPPVEDLRRIIKDQIALETKIVRDVGIAGTE